METIVINVDAGAESLYEMQANIPPGCEWQSLQDELEAAYSKEELPEWHSASFSCVLKKAAAEATRRKQESRPLWQGLAALPQSVIRSSAQEFCSQLNHYPALNRLPSSECSGRNVEEVFVDSQYRIHALSIVMKDR